ncbi:hypothetical protein BDW59DRAFT_138673, partial [Aspergillus cavernicola]
MLFSHGSWLYTLRAFLRLTFSSFWLLLGLVFLFVPRRLARPFSILHGCASL